jgi:hemolysin III
MLARVTPTPHNPVNTKGDAVAVSETRSITRELAALPRPRLRGWIHAAMVPLAVVGGFVLWRAASPEFGSRVGVLVFAASLVGLYATSSVYHLRRWPLRVSRVLRRCDVVMIQVFIAGTFTPVAIHALHGAWRTWSLVVAWAIVGVGTVLVLSPLRAPRWLTGVAYLAFGWLGAIPAAKLIGALPWGALGLIALGGLLYSLGALVFVRRWPDPWPRWFGFHEVFHLFVVAGATAHYIAIWRYVVAL